MDETQKPIKPIAVIDWLMREALIDESTFRVSFHPIKLSVCLQHGCVLICLCARVFVLVSHRCARYALAAGSLFVLNNCH